MHRLFLGLLLGSFASGSLLAQGAQEIRGYDPVTVSAANYRDTPREELLRLTTAPTTLNPDAPAPDATAREPQYYVFVPGEIYASDITYEQICELLTPALSKRNFINAADAQGIIRDPENVSLLLRVHYGSRDWRVPTVRTEQLSWSEGLVPRQRGRSLTTLGGEVLWDNRSGGNDNAMAQSQTNQANAAGNFGFSSQGTPTSAENAGAASISSQGATESGLISQFSSTREFHLIVVDAFDYQEVKTKARRASRLWTTFVSAPTQRGQRFSDIVDTLVRNATPFFGETSRGLQVYTDARAEVTLGDATVVPDEQP